MKPRWTRGMDKVEISELKASYLDGCRMRERLVGMLREDIDHSLHQMRDAAKAQIPNLAEYYADGFARQDVMENLIKLLEEKNI